MKIFWKHAERRRRALGEQGAHVHAITFGEASRWSPGYQVRSTRLWALGAAFDTYQAIRSSAPPVVGFSPEDLSPLMMMRLRASSLFSLGTLDPGRTCRRGCRLLGSIMRKT